MDPQCHRSVGSREDGGRREADRRLKRIDRAAVFVITLGGLAVVVGVLGILFFIVAEAVPLFRPARVTRRRAARPRRRSRGRRPGLRALGVDEYRRYLFTVDPDAHVVFYGLPPTAPAGARLQPTFPLIPGLEPGTPIVSSSRSLLGNFLAAGTATAAWR